MTYLFSDLSPDSGEFSPVGWLTDSLQMFYYFAVFAGISGGSRGAAYGKDWLH
ncbi:hypothetical protein [Erwinia sp. E602]|uniref:hypothetical protein n=1 Tax=Erwinia sp. E602 TaxID=2675378 RepID=UPI001BAA87F8|nr:hypothetical protein [Erwinia sp. E602]